MGKEIEDQTDKELLKYKSREIDRWQDFKMNADFHYKIIDLINTEQVKRMFKSQNYDKENSQ